MPLTRPSPEETPTQSCGGPEPSPAIAKAKEFVADIFRRAKEARGGISEEARPPPCTESSGSRCQGSAESQGSSGEAAPHDSSSANQAGAPEPGYINYTKLYYVLGSGEWSESEEGEWAQCPDGQGPGTCSRPTEPSFLPAELEDDKISLPFVVTDLRGCSLKPMRGRTAVQVGVGRVLGWTGGARQAAWTRPSDSPRHRASISLWSS